ncbi:hypothetical protein GQ600_2782 [Phytophthora cactorum]|nr:hypothetical protein GQ600_2782 [Phytophthora cactorum]
MYVTAVLCAESFLHLDNNRGTRVVFVDGFMKSHFKGYVITLQKCNRRGRVLKLTVWDPQHRSAGGLVSIWARWSLRAVSPNNSGLIDEFSSYDAATRSRRTSDVHDEYTGDYVESRAQEDEEENVLLLLTGDSSMVNGVYGEILLSCNAVVATSTPRKESWHIGYSLSIYCLVNFCTRKDRLVNIRRDEYIRR